MNKKRKIIISSLVIIFLIASGTGIKCLYDYLRYRKELSNFETPNFENSTSYVSCNLRSKVRPGDNVEYTIYYKNEGLQDVFNFKIEIKLSKYLTVSTVSVGGEGGKIQTVGNDLNNTFEIFVGSLPVGQGGNVKIRSFLKSPIDNGTSISSPVVRFFFEKKNEYIHREEKSLWEVKSNTTLLVESNPDFSGSKIELASERYREVTKNEEVSYLVFVQNNGDMNAKNLEIIVNNLKFLDIQDISSSIKKELFELGEDIIKLKLDELSVGEKIEFGFTAKVSQDVENNFVLEPELWVSWKESLHKLGSVSSLVKLYPSFENSKIVLSDLNGSFTVPGDRLLVNIYIVNSGDADANKVSVDLIFSDNLLISDENSSHWEFEKIVKGDEVNITTELKVVDGISKDTYGNIRFKISCEELKDFESEKSSIFIKGIRHYNYNYLPIIALHGIQPNPLGKNEISTSNFEYLLSLLKSNGYQTITFFDLINYLDNKLSLPDKAVIITSDDGYQSIYQYAFPLLKKYNYTMTVFLSTGYIGESESERREDEFNRSNYSLPTRGMLIWPEVLEMAKYGVEFQSHGVTHTSFLNLNGENSLNELLSSKEAIENHIKKPVSIIAWPFNRYDREDLEFLGVAGYRGAVTYGGGVEDLRSINLYKIKRVVIDNYISPNDYAKLLKIE